MKFEEDPSQRDIDHLGQRLLPNIRLVSTSRNLRKIRAFSPNEPSQRRARARTSSQPMIDVVVIGISTGGPNALSKVIPLLPERLGVPILIVQHMPPTFTESMAKYLGTIGKIKIKEAESNDLVQPDTLYIAPGGKHMVVEKTDLPPGQVKIALNENPHQNGCRPSVDVLLHSVTNVYGGNALVLIMTGMGKDGAAGVAAIKKLGGYCITQTKASCVVYGMPRVIDELGLSDESVSLEDMAKRIIHLTRRETRSLKP